MLFLVKSLGFLLSRVPESGLNLISKCFGDFVYLCGRSRRIMALRNLHHAFPEKSEAWRRAILREHCRRLIEMSLYVLCSPFYNQSRMREILTRPARESLDIFDQANKSETGSILLIPHFTLSETISAMPLHFEAAKGRVSVIFRPLNNRKLNEWVTWSRSRFGVELLSRKSGYSSAIRRLETGGSVGILFDQNASGKGSKIHFMDRVVSATELPGILAHRKNSKTYVVYAERTAFFRARVSVFELNRGSSPIDLTLGAHKWLAEYLGESSDHCADWLWLHDRWGSPKNPKRRFQLKPKRNRLREDAAFRAGEAFSRTTSVWLLLPEQESKDYDLPEILLMIRKARPDYALCLISERSEDDVLRKFSEHEPDRIVQLPDDPRRHNKVTAAIAKEYPDVWINLRTTRKSLILSKQSHADQRFGIDSVQNARKYLTDLAPAGSHTWIPFFKKFGLVVDEPGDPLCSTPKHTKSLLPK